ncbi:TolC family protein [Pedobacter sp. P351]|uniref:TolC family protein n=1 Tax=Pedobacter superstes TaxID=3133441 RepID=UPI0030B0EB49
MKLKNIVLLFLLGIYAGTTSAQEILTLEEAVRITLENNYNILISKNDAEIAERNVNRANAGMLPAVSGTLNNNNTIQNSTQTRSTGEVTERNNARGNSLNYGVGLNWTIFDGFRMFARYDQLKELQRLGDANLQLNVLTTLGDVMEQYFNLVQQQQQLKAFDTAVSISRLRVKTAQTRFEVGKAARLEILNAQVDYNTDTASYLQQEVLYKTSQISLNELMGRDVNIQFRVADGFQIDESLVLGKLLTLSMQQNPALRAALISKRIAELDLKQVKANRYPVIGLNSGYNFNRSESALGFATQTTGRGFNYGLSASVNIFNGFLQRRNEKNSEVLIRSADLDYQRINQSVNAQLASAYQTYLTNLSLVKLEENNLKIASQNLDITLTRYRLGTITQVEIRDAQLNYLNAAVRLNNSRYQAKIAEVSLKEISGSINL